MQASWQYKSFADVPGRLKYNMDEEGKDANKARMPPLPAECGSRHACLARCMRVRVCVRCEVRGLSRSPSRQARSKRIGHLGQQSNGWRRCLEVT